MGLGLGSVIGGDSARDVAVAQGALGGGALGKAARGRNDQPLAGEQILVRLSNGVPVSATQPVRDLFQVRQSV